jgi:23S rRNA (guanosine2251-2'-O)-methyltransferase
MEANTDNELIFGTRPVLEALESGLPVEKVFVANTLRREMVRNLRQKAKLTGAVVQEVPLQKLDRLTPHNHQGVAALVSPVPFVPLTELLDSLAEKGKTPLLVIADGITDVRNLGSIIRTAEALGADGLIMPARDAAPVNAEAVKASAGAAYKLPLCREKHFGAALQMLAEQGIDLVACTEKANKEIWYQNLTGPIALVVGSEELGIHEKTMERCKYAVRIPLCGETASLNVAVATGIALGEAIRMRSTQNLSLNPNTAS